MVDTDVRDMGMGALSTLKTGLWAPIADGSHVHARIPRRSVSRIRGCDIVKTRRHTRSFYQDRRAAALLTASKRASNGVADQLKGGRRRA